MNGMKLSCAGVAIFAFAVAVLADGINPSRMEWFKDQKLALMMHFGLYSEVGIVESWPLSDADSYWSRKEVEPDIATNGFKEAYFALNKSFNPVRFRPDEWAEEALRDGFKYVIFTTKHHDGFCLYDSKYTDYKVTDPSCPFSSNPRADIVRHLFDECRKRNLGVGAYFSKPDWHHDDYWENAGIGRFTNRNATYDPRKSLEKWARFKEFFRGQVLELVRDYGPLDILWLDGVWLQKSSGQDLDVASVVAEARMTTPGLIAVDRNGGECEDVKTPEQFVPGKISDKPWESCVTMSENWGYHYDDVYKSPRTLVHMLVDVVAKGGNLALNVGPAPDGRLPRPAVERMRELGSWLKKHGEAIYATRPVAPYRISDWAFTQGKDGTRYAIYLRNEGENTPSLFMRLDPSIGNILSLRHLASGVECPVRLFENSALRQKGYAFDFPKGVMPDRYADVFVVEDADVNPCRRVAAMDASYWGKSEWICALGAHEADEAAKESSRAADGTSWFLREFTNECEVTSAKWMTTGLGVYELYVNGKIVGDDVLKPGYTHVKKTRRSFTYDVTPLFRKNRGDRNFLAAEVSAGWWRDKIVNYAGRKSAFRAVLEIAYADGSVRVYGTNAEEWKAGVGGPVTHAGIFDGEEYDAREEPPFFGCPSFANAVRSDEFRGEILPSDGGEVCCRRDKTLVPVRAYVWKGTDGADSTKEVFGVVHKLRDVCFDGRSGVALAKGEKLVVDFGQNCAAVPSFEFKASEGTVLTCLPAEMLNESNGERSRGNDGPAGSIYRENLRIPDFGMRIRYTFGKACTGNGGFARYQPAFSFFGYRYVSVEATGDVVIRKVGSVPLSSITKEMELGSLVTGVESVNKLVSNVYWGQLSNYLSVPTDCPQRNERLGWSADTQVFCEAGAFNADTRAFFRKWMRDLRDSQDEEGGYTAVAPYALLGNLPFAFGWADAGVIVPYQIWKQFGQREIVDDNFNAMEKFVRRLDETKYDFEGKLKYIYADWLSYETFETRGNRFGDWNTWKDHHDAQNYRRFLAACYWLYDAELVAQMAYATGRDTTWFEESGKCALAHIRRRFLEPDGLLLKPMRHIQTACVFALRFGIVEGSSRDETLAILLKSIKDHGDCLQTGFLGTSFLMETLSMCGRDDVAYDLLLQRNVPSWLYPVEHGATTIWERWNSYTSESGFGPVMMNSFNHYAYGAVLAWMYKDMAGIAADPKAPGFKNIVMAPKPDKRMGFVNAEYKSVAGLVKSSWRYEGDAWTWEFSIPEGSTADITIPGEETSIRYKAGTYSIKTMKGKRIK